MCLDIYKRSKIKIAQTDIKVYKCLDEGDEGEFYSPYRGTVWKVGETKSVKYFTNRNDENFISNESVMRKTSGWLGSNGEVNAGLHSFTRLGAVLNKHENLYTAVIPKGTRYIIGDDGEVVSLKLKLVGNRAKVRR